MDYRTRYYPESLFGGFTNVDGTTAFFCRVNSLITPASVVLDVGCGRGEYSEDPVEFRKRLRILKGKAARVIGIDVDPNARTNPFVDEFHLVSQGKWPVESDSVDLVLCDFVVEHVSVPQEFFSEVRRVLKDGGYVCIRTTNRLSYVGLCAMLIPNRLHAKVVSRVQNGRKEEDVFPTVYKCNSVRKLRRLLAEQGFSSVVYGYEAEPAYLSFSRISYYLGVLHQRFAPSFLKPGLVGFGKLSKASDETSDRIDCD